MNERKSDPITTALSAFMDNHPVIRWLFWLSIVLLFAFLVLWAGILIDVWLGD